MDPARAARAEGAWKRFKGRLREAWGDATQDEPTRLRGEREALVGSLQARAARERAEIERNLERGHRGPDDRP